MRCAAVLAALVLAGCSQADPQAETNGQLTRDLIHAGDLIGEHDRRISALESQVRELQGENAALRARLTQP
jgi:outer membrane murein-binding lipoprotein Lpp